MAASKHHDPFKPEQPSIPGVPAAASERSEHPHPAPADSRTFLARTSIPAIAWVVAVLLLVGGLGAGLAHWTSGSSAAPQPSERLAAQPLASPSRARTISRTLPVAPGIIGTTRELARPWAAKRFLFRSDLSAHPVPALVVHLPNGQYWGLSMVEPFGTCELQYVTDPRILAAQYGFRADHPMIGNPCTDTVYDLLQYDGGAPDGGLVRGAIVHGTGVRPPLAIEIEVHKQQILAVRME